MRAATLAVFLAVVPAVAFAAAPAATSSLTVKIENVSNKGGNLRLGIYDKVLFEARGSKPVDGRILPAKAGEMVLTFDGLKPGEYGVKTFQDENGNGVLDMLLGVAPSEPFGISNDAQPHLGPASWDDAKFMLKPGGNTITIHLH